MVTRKDNPELFDENGHFKGQYKSREAYLESQHRYAERVAKDPDKAKRRRELQYRAYGLLFGTDPYITGEELTDFIHYFNKVVTIRLAAMEDGSFAGRDQEYPEFRHPRYKNVETDDQVALNKAKRIRSQRRSYALSYAKFVPMTRQELISFADEVRANIKKRLSELN
jgi:hypothetical protein